MYRDGSWAESPTQPTICLSTVDQVGSRLLFRGYGVSPYQRAVHAGLVGNDSLILVDEAHLSRPFIETLKAVEFYRSERWAEKHLETPFQVVVMSATAGRAAEAVGPMQNEERRRPLALALDPETDKNPDICPELVLRLNAKKLARLDESSEEEFVATVVKHAIALSEGEAKLKSADVVGVVVNRVRTARAVADLLRERFRADRPLVEGESEDGALDVVLLTGRIRPYDRDALVGRLLPFVKATANGERTDYGRPAPPRGKLFVVATQTVEVGADFSFDALVTELAPIDALRQRFGRLDRLGFRKESRAVIVRNKDADKEDPIYGEAPTEVWKKLKEWEKASRKRKEVDFGIESMDGLLRRVKDSDTLCSPVVTAPVMMPSHVDDWAQTTIPPVPDPNPELFLHGPSSGPPDVSVVWRADLPGDLLRSAADARRLVALVPPVSMEALSVPVWQARAWLAAVAGRQGGARPEGYEAAPDFTDLEGEPEPEEDTRRAVRRAAPFLRWRGPERGGKEGKGRGKGKADEETIGSADPDDIRPGDTIVVPSRYGGCDRFGWNPECSEEVADVADDCSWRARRRPVLRVHLPSCVQRVALAAWGVPPDEAGRPAAEGLAEAARPGASDDGPDPRSVLAALRSAIIQTEWLARAAGDRRARAVPYPDDSGVVILLPVQRPGNDAEPELEGPADDEGNSFIGTGDRVPLGHHCEQVRQRSERFCSLLGLPEEITAALRRAANLHDAGKADPRFQLWLYGGEAEAARDQFALIAKSSAEWRNAAAVEASRRRAGWPKGGRHEALSVLLVRNNPVAIAGLSEAELMIHLVGTHHGRGRPLWPVEMEEEPSSWAEQPPPVRCGLHGVEMSSPMEIRPEAALAPLHAGWVDSFWRMVTRFGWWGLAYLEALLVLADHAQSRAEKEG
jgi:CRISPR-associated endonuclease/helicase Cas3